MVGWKTRQVPDQRKYSDSLYGPCAPIPPKEQALWVRDIHAGYGSDEITTTNSSPGPEPQSKNIRMEPLPCVSPAWEEIIGKKKDLDTTNTGPPLQVPRLLDRRFFVKGAPQCFSESLFEDDDT